MQTLITVIVISLLALGVIAWLNRPRVMRIDAPLPPGFPDSGFSHAAFERLLARYVDNEGNVDYRSWHAAGDDVAALNGYLAAVAAFSPDATPARFADEQDELAYWLYAYNAYVIRGVLEHWPIDSVTDVRAPVEAVRGLGFFYRNRYRFGGKPLSLYAVENRIVRRRYPDPRIHFVLNCGSGGCPVIRSDLPRGRELEALLEKSAKDFVNDANNVAVDHAARVVHLSPIFKWYRKDFLNALRAAGQPASGGLLACLTRHADDGLRRDLARAADYELRYHDFDWSLNQSTGA